MRQWAKWISEKLKWKMSMACIMSLMISSRIKLAIMDLQLLPRTARRKMQLAQIQQQSSLQTWHNLSSWVSHQPDEGSFSVETEAACASMILKKTTKSWISWVLRWNLRTMTTGKYLIYHHPATIASFLYHPMNLLVR